MKKLIDCFRTILLISSFFMLDRHPPFFEIKFKERRNKMKLFDYKGRDFKEIRIDNNEKKYFVRIGKEYIGVPKEVYRVYKADYLRTYRSYKRKKDYAHTTYEEDRTIDKDKHILDMDHYYIDQIDKKESIHSLLEAMKQLDKEQYFIIYSIYFKGETESSVARKLNISQQALNWKKKKILLFLKNYLLNSSNSNES